MQRTKPLEFSIDISETPKDRLDGLILGLIYSGYEVYFDIDRDVVCFQGWADEVLPENVEIIDKEGYTKE